LLCCCCAFGVYLIKLFYEYRHNKATRALLVLRNEFQADDVTAGGSYEFIEKMANVDDTVRHASVGDVPRIVPV
jgi:hypothetical protein